MSASTKPPGLQAQRARAAAAGTWTCRYHTGTSAVFSASPSEESYPVARLDYHNIEKVPGRCGGRGAARVFPSQAVFKLCYAMLKLCLDLTLHYLELPKG